MQYVHRGGGVYVPVKGGLSLVKTSKLEIPEEKDEKRETLLRKCNELIDEETKKFKGIFALIDSAIEQTIRDSLDESFLSMEGYRLIEGKQNPIWHAMGSSSNDINVRHIAPYSPLQAIDDYSQFRPFLIQNYGMIFENAPNEADDLFTDLARDIIQYSKRDLLSQPMKLH